LPPADGGVLPLLKPVGPTSHDVVASVRRWLGERRVGHLGTLDPAAGGLLVVVVGGATRAARLLDPPETAKTYRAWIWLGLETDGDDAQGRVVRRPGAAGVTRERLAAAVAARVGEQRQVPPARSAVRVAGERAYALARRGEAPPLAPRPVVVEAARVLDWRAGEGRTADLAEALVEVTLRRGGYVRAWVRDVGRDLGCGGAVRVLVRGRVGAVEGADALTLAEAEELAAAGRLRECLWPVDRLLPGWPEVVVAPDPTGRWVGRGRPAPPGAAGWVRLCAAPGASAWALAHADGGRWREVVRLDRRAEAVS
jgi:tRNA pseudouridine55 synthase